jgi:threonine dehydrogenase-like Zn-dependent dehydrogenase
MRATVMYGAGDVRIEVVPDAQLVEPTDALVTVTRAAICGSDLWPYKSMEPSETGRRMGHEFIGVVEEVGADVQTLNAGDLVVSPFVWSDGTCVFCQEGLQTSCLHGGRYGDEGVDGGQGEAVRVPQADGTLVALPVGKDDELMPSLLALTDVMATGHYAALSAEIGPGKTVAVVGDGAVGLCGVIAARRLDAERIILLGRHPDRIALAKEFGATDVVSERGDEAVERVRELTGGPRRPLSPRVRRAGTVHGHGSAHRSPRRGRGPGRRSPGGVDPGRGDDVFRQRDYRRGPRSGARVHRGAAT